MQMEFEIKNKTLLASLDGEIDHHTCADIRHQIDKYIDKGTVENIIFNFEKVTFMDSSGIGVIIGRYKNINKLGGKVAIVNLSAQMERIFEISGLMKIIPLYENIDQALKDIEEGEKQWI